MYASLASELVSTWVYLISYSDIYAYESVHFAPVALPKFVYVSAAPSVICRLAHLAIASSTRRCKGFQVNHMFAH